MAKSPSLRAALANLRRDLTAAQAEADEQLKLRIKSIELEVALEAATEAEVEGGASFWVVVTRAAAKHSRNHIHRLTLNIEPVHVDEEGSEAEVDVASRQRHLDRG